MARFFCARRFFIRSLERPKSIFCNFTPMNVNNLLLRVNDAAAEGGFYADLASAPADIIRPVQTHSCNIGVIGEDGGISDFADTDALICFRRGMAIGVKTADCVPVLVFAPDIRAVAAIHAGWKGSLGGIVSRTMEMLADAGADMELIKAAMGPCISGRNYEVSQELAETFATAGFSDCILGGNRPPGRQPQASALGRRARRQYHHAAMLHIREQNIPLMAPHPGHSAAPSLMD